MNNVRDFGAAGDGSTLDTLAIQNAVNAGGVAYFPPGTYLTGTIYLQSGGGLELAEGAMILGSTNPEDYNSDHFDDRNAVFAEERVSGAHLIVAMDCHDITIRGKGTINGNGERFFKQKEYLNWGWHRPIFSFSDWRPGQMIFLCGCSDISIRDVALRNSSYWNLFLHDCSKAEISNLNIRTCRYVTNSDGIDIDCCREVLVHDCDINSGDDSIAVRANGQPLGRKNAVCENIVVRDCRLSSSASGLRIGVGDGLLRNCRFENIEIYDTDICIALCPCYSRKKCVQMEDIVISHCAVSGRQALLLVPSWFEPSACDYSMLKPVRNIFIRDFRGESTQGSLLCGTERKGLFRDIHMENVDLKLLSPTEPPRGTHWNCSKYGVLNIWNIPEFDSSGVTGENHENLPLVVYQNTEIKAIFKNKQPDQTE